MYIIVLTFLLECKTEKRNSQCEQDSQWSKQEACFARANLRLSRGYEQL